RSIAFVSRTFGSEISTPDEVAETAPPNRVSIRSIALATTVCSSGWVFGGSIYRAAIPAANAVLEPSGHPRPPRNARKRPSTDSVAMQTFHINRRSELIVNIEV